MFSVWIQGERGDKKTRDGAPSYLKKIVLQEPDNIYVYILNIFNEMLLVTHTWNHCTSSMTFNTMNIFHLTCSGYESNKLDFVIFLIMFLNEFCGSDLTQIFHILVSDIPVIFAHI